MPYLVAGHEAEGHQSDKSVSTSALTAGHVLALPLNKAIRLAIQRSLEAESWRYRMEHAALDGELVRFSRWKGPSACF
jgi:hypothetical protein